MEIDLYLEDLKRALRKHPRVREWYLHVGAGVWLSTACDDHTEAHAEVRPSRGPRVIGPPNRMSGGGLLKP